MKKLPVIGDNLTMSTAQSANYVRPPILEAVIGITFSQPLGDKTLDAADRRIGKHYLVHEDVKNTSFSMSLNVGADRKLIASPADSILVSGHKRMNPSMDELVVLMPDSITVSQLAPYQGWNHFLTRFKRDFHGYMGRQKAREISRIGVRYINRIDIPISGDIVQHEQYLNFYPRVADSLGDIVGYGMQVSFAARSIGGNVTLRSGPVASPTLGHASFMLDVDVYKTSDLPMGEAALYDLLGKMRSEKNHAFEECITARARKEIFEYANS